MDLLNKTRRISKILQRNAGHNLVDFDEVAEALCDIIGANIYVVGPEGKLLGMAINHDVENERMNQYLKTREFPPEYAKLLMEVDKSMTNVDVDSPYTAYPTEMKEMFKNGYTTIVPIMGGGDHLGTLVLSRLNNKFEEDDLILAEYGATVVGMEILRERAAKLKRKHGAVRLYSWPSTPCPSASWKRLNTFSTNWMAWKGSWSQAKLPTVWELHVPSS